MSEEITLATIEGAAKKFADRREDLAGLVRTLNDQVEAIKRAALPDIKKAVGRAAEAETHLRGIVGAVPGMFVRPRTVVFHGIKCGWEKGKGRIVFEDGDRVCELVRKHFPEMAEALVITKESPNKKALAELSAADLKRLGITIEDTGDQVVVRAVDGEVDKVVDALLREATTEGN